MIAADDVCYCDGRHLSYDLVVAEITLEVGGAAVDRAYCSHGAKLLEVSQSLSQVYDYCMLSTSLYGTPYLNISAR
jgi:hypothetical protein